MIKFRYTFLTVAATLLIAATTGAPAQAAYIDPVENEIVSEGGEVLIRFDDADAGHSTNVSVEGGETVFNNQTAASGDLFSLGLFAAGEIVALQFDNLTSGATFFTGRATRNFDGFVHAILTANADGSISLGVEDLVGGGDLDFNDITATVFERPVFETPIPGAAWLLLSGFVGLMFAARARQRA